MVCLNEEESLECLYSLPENDDSEEDCNEDAAEELVLLEVTNSGCDERDGAFAVAVDISEEETEPDHQNSSTSGDESEWGDSVSCFENITRALDQNPVICPDLTQETQMWTCGLSSLHSYRRNTGNYSGPDKSLRNTGARQMTWRTGSENGHL
jgi:hypothetical protein